VGFESYPRTRDFYINEIRLRPISGVAPDGNGDPPATSVGTSSLINLIDAAVTGTISWDMSSGSSQAKSH